MLLNSRYFSAYFYNVFKKDEREKITKKKDEKKDFASSLGTDEKTENSLRPAGNNLAADTIDSNS